MQIRGNTQIIDATIPAAKVDVSIIIAAGSNAFSADQSMGGFKLINVGTPTVGTDVANKNYVDTAIQGMSQKPTARVATTAALPSVTYANGSSGVGATLTATATGVLTVDGIATALNDLILVKDQASAFQNGLYTVTTAGAVGVAFVLTRHTSMDVSTEFEGALIPVDNEGTANKNTVWLTNNVEAGYVVGTTAVTFVSVAGPGSLTQGNGIIISGVTISINAGNGLTFLSGALTILSDPTGGTNLSRSINVVSNGVSVKVDDSTITEGGSNRLKVKAAGITKLELAAQASGTGLQGGNNTDLSIKIASRETPSGTVNGSNVVFTLANTPMSGTEMVYLNGILQDAGGNDYTISTVTITFTAAPLTGDKIRVTYFY